MYYVKIKTCEIITRDFIKKEHPFISFPKEISSDFLSKNGYAVLDGNDDVAFNDGEYVFETDKAVNKNGKWLRIIEVKKHEKKEAQPLSYRDLRNPEYPYIGDAADIAYKQRQKARMQIGKARAALDSGDLATALQALMEAVEPVEDAKDYDGQVSATKKKHPKPEQGDQ